MSKKREDLINPNYGMVIHRDFVPLYADDNYAQFFGYQNGQEILDLDSIFPLINHDQKAITRSNYDALMSGQMKPQVRSFRHLDEQGVEFFILAIEHIVDWQGAPALQIAYVDISSLTQAEAKVRESEQRFRDLIEGSIQGMVIHKDFKPLMVNQAYATMHGYDSPSDILALPDLRVLFSIGSVESSGKRAKLILSNQLANSNLRFENICKDGESLWVELVERKVSWNNEDAIQTTLIDVTKQVLMEKKLIKMAMTDSLTALFNRRYLMEESAKAFELSKASGGSLACILIDLDKFKAINDKHGHSVGDEILKIFALRCQALVHAPNFIGRYGGEEFLLVLPRSDGQAAYELAEQLRINCMSKALESSVGPLQVTMSAGVSCLEVEDLNFDQLIDRADKHLYKAKELGRNKVIFEQ